MKYSIYDACFSEARQSGRGMSAEYLSWELKKNGLSEYSIPESDCILVTCQSVESVQAIQTIKKRYSNKLIVCGGAASTSPYSIGKNCDAVCVGDGQLFLSTLFSFGFDEVKKMSNCWIDGEERRVEIDQDFPWNMPPIQAEDGAYRLWCGRGCKNKCKFCQTGWAYKYSENPNPEDVIFQAKTILLNHKKIAYLSNDVSQHSFYSSLPPTEHGSYSVRFLKKTGLPPARQIRLGIEGVSERLRQLVSKPINTADLIGCT
jgi:tRNA A37 methylthiotransferase MiaB